MFSKNLNLFCLISEQLILGSLLINKDIWNKICNILFIEDFYFKNHKVIYSIICNLISTDKNFDIIILSNKIKNIIKLNFSNILNYLEILIKKSINFNNIYNYAIIIHNIAIIRKLFFNINNLISNFFLSNNDIEDLLKKVEFDISDLDKNYNKSKSNLSIIGPIFEKILLNLEILNKSGINISGIPTGFIDLDNILSGLHNGDLIIIAGRPSMGKTAFSINIAQNIALNLELPVIIFSMEMSNTQLATRILNSISCFNQHNFKIGNLSSYELLKLKNIVFDFYTLKIFIDESINLNSLEIYYKSKKIIKEYGKLGLIIIDYLQLMNSINSNKNRVMEISDISRSLKCLARELNVPVIAISQLNRSLEFRNNKRPIMSDLRESGSIEQDADVILFIYRDEIYNPYTLNKGTAEILVAKHRNGPTGIVKLLFSSNNLKFSNFKFD